MSAFTGETHHAHQPGEWDELSSDGQQAWVGMIMVVVSGFVSLRILGWLATTVCAVVMQ